MRLGDLDRLPRERDLRRRPFDLDLDLRLDRDRDRLPAREREWDFLRERDLERLFSRTLSTHACEGKEKEKIKQIM